MLYINIILKLIIITREEQILNKAVDYSEIEENFLEYDDCGDVCDDKGFVEKAFIEGAKWADEHSNLYNMKLWIARNQDNSLHIHNVKPSLIYDDYTKQWTYEGDLSMEIDENLYSEVTFDNSPQEVELKLVEK